MYSLIVLNNVINYDIVFSKIKFSNVKEL